MRDLAIVAVAFAAALWTTVQADVCASGLHNCHENATCLANNGGFSCACNEHFTGNGTYCELDDCAKLGQFCDKNADCVQRSDRIPTCNCKTMFEGNGTYCEASTCDNGNRCDDHAVCSLQNNAFECDCVTGYKESGISCVDIDECSNGGHNCHENATCQNTNGGFNCTCNSDFTGNGTDCAELDACAKIGQICHEDALCRFDRSPAVCTCKTMYQGNGTFCEAATCENGNRCGPNANCILENSAFQCPCETGYKASGILCVDVDECALNTHGCHENATCTNTDGSYTCACNRMYRGDGINCEEMTCENTKPCGSNSICSVKNQAFSCECEPGFTGGLSCDDIDECAANPCHADAVCTNSQGSYTCECKTGFFGDGLACEVNECSSPTLNNCDGNATCEKTTGSYSCTCNDLYRGNGTSCEEMTCENIKPCGENTLCTRGTDSFDCTCLEGFSGGLSCSDIDECADSSMNDCHDDADCVNIPGSYECKCKTMFRGNGTFCEAQTCENTKPCGTNTVCSIASNAFQCNCLEGFTGGLSCTDIDECAVGTNPCQDNTTCVNSPGSYSCVSRSRSARYTGNEYIHFCPSRNITYGSQRYSFSQTKVGDIAFSKQKCSNGRAMASVTCMENDGQYVFDETTFNDLPCNETIKSVVNQVNWQEAHDKELEKGISKLNILVSNATNLTVEDRKDFLQAVNTASTSLLNKTNAVTVQTLREMVVGSNAVTESFKATVASGFSSNSSINKTIIKDGQILVHALRVFAEKVQLPDERVTITTENIRAEVQTNLSPENNSYEYSSEKLVITIPREALLQANKDGNETSRLVYFEFSGRTLFHNKEIVKTIITAEFGVDKKIANLQDKVQFSFRDINESTLQPVPVPGKYQSVKQNPQCKYYVPENMTFSNKGCYLVRNTTYPICKCDHMTSFSILMETEVVDDNIALSVVTTIGCVLSSIGLLIVIFLHFVDQCDHSMKNNRQRSLTIYVHICASLLGVYMTFLIGISQTENGAACTAVSAILHYLLLATWCWTTVYSYCMYTSLATLGGDRSERHYMIKSAVFAYGAPLIGVAITMLVNLGGKKEDENDVSYKEDSDEITTSHVEFDGYRAPNMCWLTGNSLRFGFLLPAGIMLLVNYIFFGFLVYLLVGRRLKMKDSTSRKHATREIIASASLATTLGLTWVFGYLMLANTDIAFRTIMSWLFTITNVLQGFGLFGFTMLKRAELRQRILSSVKDRFTSISAGMTKKTRSVRHGKKTYVVNNSMKSDYSIPSIAESTENPSRMSAASTCDTSLSECKSENMENSECA